MMKRLLSILLLAALLLPVAAQAGFPPDNEGDWNKTVRYRTTRSTTLYSLSFRDGKDSWGPDEDMADDAIFTPIGTLPAGKYVNVISYEMCGKREVFYWDGGRRSAWIDEDSYTRDTVTITSTSGQTYAIPRKAYGDVAAVRYILSEFYSADEIQGFIDGMSGESGSSGGSGGSSGESSGSQGGSGSSGGSSGGGSSGGASARGKSLPLPTITLTATAEDGTSTSCEVKLVQAGLLHSVVMQDGGEEQTVLTSALSWECGEAEHALAVIYAPRGGTATLWQKSTGKSAICKLAAGHIVLVLEKGGKYTKVLGEGKVGYVLTSALTLTDPAGEGEQRITTRKLTLRLEAKAKGRSLTTIPKGTTVTVLNVQGKWALVEYEGLAGYVEAKYLKE